MDSGTRRSQRDYTLAFKLSVVDQVEKSEWGYEEAQRRYAHSGVDHDSSPLILTHLHGLGVVSDQDLITYCLESNIFK
ncbi:hypothetical protein SAMN04489800_3821 [Pseudomonas deceptionensis]|uniref:Uncharacterized protein n=1 Tax=Pseudomonas deceptionensis TaxID=882211 RepID=A0A1H5NQ29_PSEDM|nr:hypothetical protein [Pseudomonas deceptionensis]SEF03676.1 hypothetical protein SAMN04489800_3821 [Pseudomonas deceptionensis]